MTLVALTKAETPRADRFSEVGVTGSKNWNGILEDEFLRELRGSNGAKVYREMSKNDAVIGASLFAYTTLSKEVKFTVESAKPGDAAADEVAEFIDGALFKDMNLTWRDLLGEIFSFLTYGWSYFEIVYKQRGGDVKDPAKRSQFTDNRIGWRKWAIRSQDSLLRWEMDEHGGVNGMWQSAAPLYAPVMVPIEKALLFRTMVERNAPEGVSILRTAYPTWYEKRRIRIIRSIGIERDLAGMPVITPPDGLDIWNPNDANATRQKTNAERIVRNIRRDEHEGIVKPYGWTLELLSSGGGRQFDITTVVAQLNAEIAMSMMTDFLLVGHEAQGARSLATDKRAVFSHAAASFLDSIVGVINRFAIPQLVKLNGWSPDLVPTLAHGPVAELELSELMNFITVTSGAGLLFPDEELEKVLRERAQLPPPPDRSDRADILPMDPAAQAAADAIARQPPDPDDTPKE